MEWRARSRLCARISRWGWLAACLHRRPGFAVRFAPLDRLPLVVLLLALGETDGHLHAAVLEVHPHRHEGHALLHRLSDQPATLAPVQQQLARSERLVVGVAPVAVGTDVDVVEIPLAIVHPGEA